MGWRYPGCCEVRGWVVGAVSGAAVGALGSFFALDHLADPGWKMTRGGVAKGLAGSVLLSGALGAFVGAVSDWGDRLCDGPRARQRQAERGAAPDPARDALAERLETMGRQADLAGAADCLAALEEQFRQLTDILTAFVQGRLAPTSPAV